MAATFPLMAVIAERLDLPYRSGERAMIKVSSLRTADCVVGGSRYEISGGRRVGSPLLRLYDDVGLLYHVGFTSSLSEREKLELTQRLERLIGALGFTGDAPRGPSRWSTASSAEWQPLRPESAVEVRYGHITDNRFRHGTKLMRWRPTERPGSARLASGQRPKRN